jgi:hypothetical protein
MIKIILVFSVMMMSINSRADITGAGDAALYAQMVQMVATVKDQLQTLRDTLNVQEQLKELEALKEIKELSVAGKELKGMFSDINDINNTIEDFENDPYGTKKTEREIDYLRQQLSDADSASGTKKGAMYSSILANLENLQFLGKMNESNARKIANGITQGDAQKTTAENTLVMSTLLQNREQREAARSSREADAVHQFMSGSKYGGMGGGE